MDPSLTSSQELGIRRSKPGREEIILITREPNYSTKPFPSMFPTDEIVLVTGATGFIGSHIVSQLLAKPVKVRAVVRSASKLKSIFPHAGSQLEVVELPSLLDDHTEALKGVSAVIHTAAPAFFNGASSEETFEGVYEGTLKIVNQAISVGVRKIVVTGSIVSLISVLEDAFGITTITEKDFGAVELSEVIPSEQAAPFVYHAAKILSDKKIWEIAQEHPDVDITIIIPPLVLGPFLANYPYPSDPIGLGTTAFAYELITGGPEGPNSYPTNPMGHIIDVRDVAKAHVLALDTPPIPGRHKRIIISAGIFTWKDAAEVVRKAHPELEPRLPSANAVPPAQTDAPLDTSFASEVLGLKEYIPWQESILAAIEMCLQYEEQSKA
ncbi:hypothetical protein VNI00_016838 [Paramarasmius palmivorus]|uniref:NAD-dependent epimerase/dehydratase domain-containing protein n=1 Tax=Paramarasmius palmivorus TaxID=297713 RepID=A0AAW0BAC4_9AGAR